MNDLLSKTMQSIRDMKIDDIEKTQRAAAGAARVDGIQRRGRDEQAVKRGTNYLPEGEHVCGLQRKAQF